MLQASGQCKQPWRARLIEPLGCRIPRSDPGRRASGTESSGNGRRLHRSGVHDGAEGKRRIRGLCGRPDGQASGKGHGTWSYRRDQRRKRRTVVAKIKELTGGMGADLIIETAGSQPTTVQAIHAAKKGSTIVLVGYSKSGEMTPAHEPWRWTRS